MTKDTDHHERRTDPAMIPNAVLAIETAADHVGFLKDAYLDLPGATVDEDVVKVLNAIMFDLIDAADKLLAIARGCTSTDPADHQGDTCPIHEAPARMIDGARS